MSRNVFAILTIVGIVCRLLVPATAAQPYLPNSSPLVVLTGSDSQIKQARYSKIVSKADWAKLWLDHLGRNPERQSLEVDFDRCCVVTVFGGESVNSHGFTVESIRDVRDTTVLRFDQISYQTAGPDDGAEHVTPYAFIVLPKTDKTIVLEEDVKTLIGEPPVWKEVARLQPKQKN